MASARRAGVPFILVTLFLDVLGMGMIIPVLPELVVDLKGGDPGEAAGVFGLLVATYAAAQFATAPILGALSDRFGRRPVILLALLGFGLNYVLLALAPTLGWLFVARALSGVMGASFTAANAYVADVSTPADRARSFGLVGAAFGMGFVFGPALGGLLGHLGPRVPFWVSAGIVLVNWVYGLLVLPESLPPERRRRVSLREVDPLRGILRLRRYPLVASLAVPFLLVALAQRGLESTWVLHAHLRYGWGELENGLTLALVGAAGAVVQGLLVRRVVGALGEPRAVVLGLAVSATTFALYGLAWAGWMVPVVALFGAMGAVTHPALQSLVTGQVAPDEQGAVQGALASLISLSAIVAPVVATQAFRLFTGEGAPVELPGAAFFLGSALLLLALAAAAAALRRAPTARPLPAR